MQKPLVITGETLLVLDVQHSMSMLAGGMIGERWQLVTARMLKLMVTGHIGSDVHQVICNHTDLQRVSGQLVFLDCLFIFF